MGIVLLFLIVSIIIALICFIGSVVYITLSKWRMASLLSIIASAFLVNYSTEHHGLIPVLFIYPMLICTITVIVELKKKKTTAEQAEMSNSESERGEGE